MNPIFRQSQQANGIQQILKAGNPKQQVMNMLRSMNATQRQQVQNLLPQAQAMASRFGINNFDSVASEINKMII